MHTAFSNCSSFLPEHERFFCTLCTTPCSSKANIQEESLVLWVSWNFAEQHAKYLLFINKDKIKNLQIDQLCSAKLCFWAKSSSRINKTLLKMYRRRQMCRYIHMYVYKLVCRDVFLIAKLTLEIITQGRRMKCDKYTNTQAHVTHGLRVKLQSISKF